MKVLLDTHVFIWADSDSKRLSATARGYFTDPDWEICVSVVSIWEMAIKSAVGKMPLRASLSVILAESVAANEMTVLPITIDHVLRVQSLPAIHGDPFDRLLVAQALAEDAVLLTADPQVRRYPASTDW